ncbi:hypothetical protein J1P26_07445 [Neobacillus sp. MM2021_6]|uniref:DUF2460 domain-containing protein n=1 Tax=Bacillaceae TaxID=186817 RepID=UPI001407F823|nr:MULTISPECIES: DUF2460 domain-containing protein [Bacillaceae]MBO0959567.1 hypothetical protein [Neobacillus sp. MM2021_6]NHC17135.1 DUF2460 domain-containing protein [Bacillus sp. MM2020_4]
MAQMAGYAQKSQPLLRLEPFQGLDVSGTATQISDHRSPDALNVVSNEKGSLDKRTGYARVFADSLGAGKINDLYLYTKTDGSMIFLIAHGTKLYTQSGDAQPTVLFDGIQNGKINFFVMEGKCYIMDGVNFLVYDGSTIKAVEPYIPVLQISKNPSGGGSANEDFNLIGNKWKDSFSGDGEATVYQMSLTGLDATTVSAVVGTTTINEGSGLSVDRVNGKITFTTAPAKGTNNVIITAGKTVSGYRERIIKCTMAVGFGGSNDTRMFIAGNPDMPEYMYRSGLYDATYWLENGYYRMSEKIMGFSKQYDYLIVEKPNGKHMVSFQITEEGVVSFPSKPINNQVGTIASNSIQIIENNPVSLSKDGVYMLVASNVKDERNVVHISSKIDRKLLLESGLDNAVSIDFDKKYWLAVNGNVYVLDYTQKSQDAKYGEWYVFNNINASCFLVKDGYLYFGSQTDGLVYRFKKEYEGLAYNDDGQPINAYWKSKQLTFKADEMKKYIESVYFSLKPASRTSVDLYYSSDKAENILINPNKPIQFNLFDFANLDFGNFTFFFSNFPKPFKQKVKAKQVTHFQLMIQNNKLDESLSVLSMGIEFRYQNKIK